MIVLVYWGTMVLIALIVAIGYSVCSALIPKSDTGETLACLSCLSLLGPAAVFLGPIPVVLTRNRERLAKAKQCSCTLAQAVADAEFWYKRWLAQAQARYRQTMDGIAQPFHQKMARMRPAFADFTASANHLSPAWTDPAWLNWTPIAAAPPVTRLGELRVGIHQDRLLLPALLSFPIDRFLLFETVGPAKPTVVQAIQSLLLRLMATVPPGKLRFTFLDPVGLGQNVAPFMHLADYDEILVTGKAWTESRHIEQRLADLTEHMENVIQKYLRNQFATIEEYNAQAGEMAEPYRVLVVLDFPVNFSEAAARRLVSIAQNGSRCGVYAVILVDTEKRLPYDFDLANLERTATVIAWDGGRFVWQDEDFKDSLLELDEPPSTDLFDHILPVVGAQAKEARRVEVPFERIAPPPELWWHGDTRDGLVAPLGRAGAAKVQVLDLGKEMAQHALVAGKTGSGKSTLLHTLIATLTLTYSPDELELYLVDFKKGVEFKPYAIHELPHARVVAIESEREFGLSVLQGLDAELTRRGDLFRAAGVDHIADYRQKTGQRMPRILLIVDEFQEFFVEDDTVAFQASQILDRLVRQGRAFGIHVLLGSQTLAGAYTLARSTIGQMAVRIALQCSEADSRLILADDNPAARLLSRPGEAIYNDANGLVEGNDLFQVAWLPGEERDRYLAQVQALARERDYQPPQPQIVFEGNAPAEVAKNRPLHDLLAAPGWPAPSRRISAWLGDPIAIKEPTAAHFRRQSGSNLLIVGQRDKQAMGMMATALISLAAQHAPETTQFYVLDFSSVDATYADRLPHLVDLLPHPVQRGRRRKLPGIIAEIAAEVNRRLEEEETALWEKPAIYLLIYGLQRARDLRYENHLGHTSPSSPDGKETSLTPAKQFTTILREGPDLGIHTLVWCDTYTNLTRTLDRPVLREFEMRVVFQMSADDSHNLIDTSAGSKLGPYRALFYSEDEGRLEKFRPYGIPEIGWLEAVGRQLRKT